jgi:flagellar protein FliS
MSRGHSAYQRTQIATADRRKIVVLLYEGAISRLTQAQHALKEGDADRRVLNVNKALDIIHFLNNSLDFEQGGDISPNLRRLYDYIRDVISVGNISGDTKKLDEAGRLLTTLLEAWRTISNGGSGNFAPALEARTREMIDKVAATG